MIFLILLQLVAVERGPNSQIIVFYHDSTSIDVDIAIDADTVIAGYLEWVNRTEYERGTLIYYEMRGQFRRLNEWTVKPVACYSNFVWWWTHQDWLKEAGYD